MLSYKLSPAERSFQSQPVTGWNPNKMLHPSSLLFSLSFATFSFSRAVIILLLLLSPPPIFHSSPERPCQCQSQLMPWRKEGRNSLSPCLINNLTLRLTEWAWMVAAGIKWLEYFLNHHHHHNYSPPIPQLDLFNLGDKYMSDLAACVSLLFVVV